MDILVFGDSITQGFYDNERGGWVNRLFAYLLQRSTVEEYFSVYNLGIDGNTAKDVLDRMKAEIEARKQNDKAITIIDIGGNDSIRNLETGTTVTLLSDFSNQYQLIIQTAKQYGEVVCLGLHDSDESQLNPMPWFDGHAALEEDAVKFNSEIERLAKEGGARFISLADLQSQDFSKYSHDGDHPNAEGHALIFERVKGALEKEGLLKN